MYVCMYVCMIVCMYVRVYIYIYIYNSHPQRHRHVLVDLPADINNTTTIS